MTNVNIIHYTAQEPLPISLDSVYEIDIDENNSNIGTFSGTITSIVNDYQNEISDTSSTSPKWFLISLQRPISADKISIFSKTSDFSNTKISLIDAQGNDIKTINDSSNNTKYNYHTYVFEPCTFLQIKVEFYTTDSISIAGLSITKTLHVMARISGINDTTGLLENVKVNNGQLIITGEVGVKDTSQNDINPATLEKQEEIIDKLGLGDYYTNDIDDYSETNIMYIGKEKEDGTWLILKIDMNSGTVIRGATETNNAAYTTYSDAWSNRLSLTYGYLKDVI